MVDTAAQGPVPDLFVIGAMRAGTTTLCADLGQQRDIDLPSHKEPWVLVRCRGDAALARKMYKDFYSQSQAGVRLVDGSTSYAMRPDFPPAVAHLAAEVAPRAKVAYLVRNPVHRAISHYNHLSAWGLTEGRTFDAMLAHDERLADFGRYWWQLEPWLDAFGSPAVRVVITEEYWKQRRRTVADLAAFMGADPAVEIDGTMVLNESRQARAMTGVWQRVLTSELYHSLVRSKLPAPLRAWLRDNLLPSAPAEPSRPSLSAVEYLIDRARPDASALAEFLGREEPPWDWEATRQAFVE